MSQLAANRRGRPPFQHTTPGSNGEKRTINTDQVQSLVFPHCTKRGWCQGGRTRNGISSILIEEIFGLASNICKISLAKT